jgi:hypothetical protein
MKDRNSVAAVALMLAAILSEESVIPQEAAPAFDVQEKTIAQIQQATSTGRSRRGASLKRILGAFRHTTAHASTSRRAFSVPSHPSRTRDRSTRSRL